MKSRQVGSIGNWEFRVCEAVTQLDSEYNADFARRLHSGEYRSEFHDQATHDRILAFTIRHLMGDL